MRDRKINAVYIHLGKDNVVERSEIPIDAVFRTKRPNESLYFDFESRFEPYERFVEGFLERVDLVVREARSDGERGRPLCPLEVKLTVVPDSSTVQNNPSNWGPEIVIRPPTIMYASLSMVASRNVLKEDVRKLFQPVGRHVTDWGNEVEASRTLAPAIDALNQFQTKFVKYQMPLVLQPIWKTIGKTPMLDEQAFDLFVWSDFALARVFIDIASRGGEAISRYSRSTLRLARFLYEYGRASTANLQMIYAGMTFRHQSDKEFSLSGRITSKYMAHLRLIKPILKRETITDLILDGGEKNLSPERRFDQTVFFTHEFEKEE